MTDTIHRTTDKATPLAVYDGQALLGRIVDVVRVDAIMWSSTREDALRDILRYWIAGLSPEAADAALVDLFREINILNEMRMERRVMNGRDKPDWAR